MAQFVLLEPVPHAEWWDSGGVAALRPSPGLALREEEKETLQPGKRRAVCDPRVPVVVCNGFNFSLCGVRSSMGETPWCRLPPSCRQAVAGKP